MFITLSDGNPTPGEKWELTGCLNIRFTFSHILKTTITCTFAKVFVAVIVPPVQAGLKMIPS